MSGPPSGNTYNVFYFPVDNVLDEALWLNFTINRLGETMWIRSG